MMDDQGSGLYLVLPSFSFSLLTTKLVVKVRQMRIKQDQAAILKVVAHGISRSTTGQLQLGYSMLVNIESYGEDLATLSLGSLMSMDCFQMLYDSIMIRSDLSSRSDKHISTWFTNKGYGDSQLRCLKSRLAVA